MITKLKYQLEEARRIEETLKDHKQGLEAKIVSQKEEAENRENILTDHLKERNKDLNHLEA
jgi:vacuolar-type H+-ATPase subunit D/Vma8